jgi:superoxide dismutase
MVPLNFKELSNSMEGATSTIASSGRISLPMVVKSLPVSPCHFRKSSPFISLGTVAGPLLDAINKDFGNFEEMKKLLSQTATQIQGSGWAWLGYNVQAKRLQIVQCQNQDPLQSTTG